MQAGLSEVQWRQRLAESVLHRSLQAVVTRGGEGSGGLAECRTPQVGWPGLLHGRLRSAGIPDRVQARRSGLSGLSCRAQTLGLPKASLSHENLATGAASGDHIGVHLGELDGFPW